MMIESMLIGNTFPLTLMRRYCAGRTGGGAIVNVLDQEVLHPEPPVSDYLASRLKLLESTLEFALSRAADGIRVNAVAPGFFVNERSVKYLCTPDGGLSARGENVIHHTPMGRFGEAGDLLGCVEWLLDDEKAAFVTGITVPVDGGFLASAGV